MAALKTIDEKGRLNLGRAFAGKLVEVENQDDAIVLRFRRVVPEREAWLWRTLRPRHPWTAGLQQARVGELGDGPDLGAAFAFADALAEEG